MTGAEIDPLLIPLLDRIQDQLNRLDSDTVRVEAKFAEVTRAHNDLNARLSVVEEWKRLSGQSAGREITRAHFYVTAGLAIISLVMSVLLVLHV